MTQLEQLELTALEMLMPYLVWPIRGESDQRAHDRLVQTCNFLHGLVLRERANVVARVTS